MVRLRGHFSQISESHFDKDRLIYPMIDPLNVQKKIKPRGDRFTYFKVQSNACQYKFNASLTQKLNLMLNAYFIY